MTRRKINIWSDAVIVSPYLGPLITAFIVDKEVWNNAFWVNTGLTALCWLLVVGLMDETIYNRNIPTSQQPVPKSRMLRLVGIEQWRTRHLRQTFVQAFMRPFIAVSKIPVLLITIFYFLNFSWVIGVNATISIWLTEFYKFTPYNLGKPANPNPLPCISELIRTQLTHILFPRLLLLCAHHWIPPRRHPWSLAP